MVLVLGAGEVGVSTAGDRPDCVKSVLQPGKEWGRTGAVGSGVRPFFLRVVARRRSMAVTSTSAPRSAITLALPTAPGDRRYVGACRPRSLARRDHAQLLHQVEKVVAQPILADQAALGPPDIVAVETHRRANRDSATRDTARVGALRDPATGNHRTIHDRPDLDAKTQVREQRAGLSDPSEQPLAPVEIVGDLGRRDPVGG